MFTVPPTRSKVLPDLPSISEVYPDYEVKIWHGLFVPAGTPQPIIDKLNAALRAGVNTPEVRSRIAADGGDPMPSTPAEYTADIEREDVRWGALIRKLGLKVE